MSTRARSRPRTAHVVYRVGPGERFERSWTPLRAMARRQAGTPRAGQGQGPEAVIELAGSAAYTGADRDHGSTPATGLRARGIRQPPGDPAARLVRNRPDALRIVGSTGPSPRPRGGGSAAAGTAPLSRLSLPSTACWSPGAACSVPGAVGQVSGQPLHPRAGLVPGRPTAPASTPASPAWNSPAPTACVQVDRSILGAIRVIGDEAARRARTRSSCPTASSTPPTGPGSRWPARGRADRPRRAGAGDAPDHRHRHGPRPRHHGRWRTASSTGCSRSLTRQHGCVRFS